MWAEQTQKIKCLLWRMDNEMDAVAKRGVRLEASASDRISDPIAASESDRRHFRWRHVQFAPLVAGITGGVVSTVALHPLDLIKIRFQVDDGHMLRQRRPQYHGIMGAARLIVKNEGVRGLYKGMTPNVWGAGASWGFYFLFYNTIQTWLREASNVAVLGSAGIIAAASGAGIMTLVLTNPIWVAKTRLCLQYDAQTMSTAYGPIKQSLHYNGMVDCIRKIYSYEGVRGLYKGFVPGLFGVSHGALQFMAYEEMKIRYNTYRCRSPKAQYNTLEYLSFAALSKIFAATTTYPYQVLRARLQDQHRSYDGVIDVARTAYRYEGMRGFYKGLGPYLLHVTPNICLVFLVYEQISNRLKPLEILECADTPPAVASRAPQPSDAADRNEGIVGFYKGLGTSLVRVTPACCITFVIYENMVRLLQGNTKW